MLDIILLVLAAIHIGNIALRKGLKPGKWRLYTVLAWLGAEFAGILLGLFFFGIENILSIILLALGMAAGTYFAIKARLDNMTVVIAEEKPNRVSVSDLYPEKKTNSSPQQQ